MMNHSDKGRCVQKTASVAAALGALLMAQLAHAGPEPSTRVQAIQTREAGTAREVVIETSGEPTFSVFRLADPFRVLVDVNDASVDPSLDFQKVEDGVLRYVSTHAFADETTKIVRVEVALESEHEYDVKAVGKTIVVSVKATAKRPDKAVEGAPAKPGKLGRLSAKAKGDRLLVVGAFKGSAPTSDDVRIEHISDPSRLVVDIANVVAEPKWQTLKIKKKGVVKARLGARDDGIRVVLDLDEALPLPELSVQAERGELALHVVPQKPAPAPVAKAEPVIAAPAVVAKAEPVKAEPLEAEPLVARPEPKKAAKVEAPKSVAKASAAVAEIKEAKFEPKNGFLRLTLYVEGSPDIVKDEASSRRMPVLRVKNTALPASLIRTLDTSEVAGNTVSSVSTYTDGSDTIIAARIGGLTEHRHWKKGKRLVWDFRDKNGMAQNSQAEVLPYPEAATSGFTSVTTAARTAGQTAPEQRRARYRGRRISLDLKDADIHNVLRLLADVSKLNIVASDDVKGKVTLKLRNVPWDQALDIVLQSKQLDKVRSGNIIRVAPMEILEKEEQLRLQRKEALEKLEQLSVRLIAVSYADAKEIKPQVQALLSARGRVNVDSRTNVLIVEDVEEALFKIERLVRTLDTQTPQVLIESRIVEAATSFARELGIQWGGRLAFNQAFSNDTGLSFPNSIQAAGAADDNQTPTGGVLPLNNFAVNLPAAVGTGAGGGLGFIFGSANGAHLLSLRLTAAESEGRSKIISSPKIVTIDNREAKILSGERIPITVITANGPTTRFIDANLELLVTPHVTSDGGILMTIKAKKNELSNRTDILGTPGIITREAETEMLVQDGDTAVLGGIYKRTAIENENYVPFLGKIPVLGWLFKSTSRSDSREELLIFISPRIVNRSESLVRGG